MTTVYGIPNCDTCKRAIKSLHAAGIEHTFHDVRADGLTPAMLKRWAESLDWQTLLNRRSTTWRNLPETETSGLDRTSALKLIALHPTLLKRPIIDAGDHVIVGFAARDTEAILERLQDGNP